ncbi:OadG family transporter subunit [Massilibacteroides sp.]|uniref:OadG family transporter subunit n=1 Tax=Massilibacteroides sp. TaxID=2034766 RepID=UPI00261C5B7D|nr:OadG family transporter subunit [Massilibacteroides sp.]MDD4514853.1 OadG family transporter subunit [Massilibacteroides sp.]
MKQLLLSKIVALILCLFSVASVSGQNLKDIRINEIQVINKNGYKDNLGQAHSWIELFNTGYGKVNIGGGILKVKGKEYRIPKTSEMIIGPRDYIIFFAEGNTQRGPRYTNFTLDDTNFIEFYDPDNREEPIDRLEFNPSEMLEDVSYGWFESEDRTEKLMNLPVLTPGATNNTLETVSRSELFRQADPSGVVLTVVAVTVVLCCLFLLYIIFMYLGKAHIRVARKKDQKVKEATSGTKVTKEETKLRDGLTNEELAAIAIALYKYSEDLHDIEDTVLTINRAAKAYSPWSSKIYGLRQTLIKK